MLAGLLNAVARTRGSWTEQRVVVFGAGTAGVGIADQIQDQMVRHGLSKEDATRRVWLVDLPGLLTADTAKVSDEMIFAAAQAVASQATDYRAGRLPAAVECGSAHHVEYRWP